MLAGADYQGGGGVFSALFWKLKGATVFAGENAQILGIYGEFLIKNAVLGVPRKKNPKIFPMRPFVCLCVVAETFLEGALFLENCSVLKNSCLHAWSTTMVG